MQPHTLPRARLQPVVCPFCGSTDVGTEERLSGVAPVTGHDPNTNEFEFTGETIIDWDAAETLHSEDGRTLMFCRACCNAFAYPPLPAGQRTARD